MSSNQGDHSVGITLHRVSDTCHLAITLQFTCYRYIHLTPAIWWRQTNFQRHKHGSISLTSPVQEHVLSTSLQLEIFKKVITQSAYEIHLSLTTHNIVYTLQQSHFLFQTYSFYVKATICRVFHNILHHLVVSVMIAFALGFQFWF